MPPRHLLVIPKGTYLYLCIYIYIINFFEMIIENGNNHVNIFDFASHLNQVVEQLEKSSGVVLRRHDTSKPEVDFAKTNTPDAFERY